MLFQINKYIYEIEKRIDSDYHLRNIKLSSLFIPKIYIQITKINILQQIKINIKINIELRRLNTLGEKEEKHPTIVETQEKEILEKRPPNDKILHFTIADNKDKNQVNINQFLLYILTHFNKLNNLISVNLFKRKEKGLRNPRNYEKIREKIKL